jgi:hypothetical protein
MSDESRSKYYGTPLSEIFLGYIHELKTDIVGFWHIIRMGKDDYSLKGKELHTYIYKVIKILIENGGIPVVGAKHPKIVYKPTTQYGITPDEIAQNILDEWIKNGEKDIDAWTGIFFVTEKFLNSVDNIRKG